MKKRMFRGRRLYGKVAKQLPNTRMGRPLKKVANSELLTLRGDVMYGDTIEITSDTPVNVVSSYSPSPTADIVQDEEEYAGRRAYGYRFITFEGFSVSAKTVHMKNIRTTFQTDDTIAISLSETTAPTSIVTGKR